MKKKIEDCTLLELKDFCYSQDDCKYCELCTENCLKERMIVDDVSIDYQIEIEIQKQGCDYCRNNRLDELLDAWHCNTEGVLPIYEFMGISFEQYSKWVDDCECPMCGAKV